MLSPTKIKNTMNTIIKPIELANKIKELTGLNVFENTRRRNVIEVRSLLCHLLRSKLGMRWTSIAYFFQENGKHITHATVINSVNTYPSNKKYNKNLGRIENIFTFKDDIHIDEINKVQYLEDRCEKLQSQLDFPLVKLVKRIPKHREEEALTFVRNLVKSFEWKYNEKEIV